MPILDISDIVTTGLTVSGTTLLSGSSTILTVKGQNNNLLTISDAISGTVFSVATTGGTTQFSVLTAGTRVHTFLYDSSNSTGSTNQVLTSTSTGATWTTQSSQATPEYRQISLVTNLANAGDTGTINQTLVGIGYSGTIVGWYITCYPAATVAVDVWKANGAVPTIANTITAAAKPSITAARLNSSLTPTGWTTAVSAGDYFMLNVDSNNLATYINLQLLISI